MPKFLSFYYPPFIVYDIIIAHNCGESMNINVIFFAAG